MSKEMVISANRHETRVALLEDDQLVEVHFQRAHEYSLAGSIHKGRVTRVLPGMQSAFVDLGLERDTFLYVSDFLEEQEDGDIDTVAGPGSGPGAGSNDRGGDRGSNDRGSNDRGSRDRGRDRERRQALPTQAVEPQARMAMKPPVEPLVGAPETSAEIPTLAPPAAPTGPARSDARPDGRTDARPQDGRSDGRNDDRRGRRSRRRRNRRGLPESKYAEPSSTSEAPAAKSPEADEEIESSVSAAPELAPLILPGESLRKYRSAPEAQSSPVDSLALEPPTLEPSALAEESVEDDNSGEENNEEENGDFEVKGVDEYNLPVHYPPENALPDAPVHHPAPESGCETILAKVAASEVPPGVAALSPMASESIKGLSTKEQSARELPVEEVPDQVIEETYIIEERLDESVSVDRSESDAGPAVASLLDEDEDLDIQAMILGEVEDLDGPESGPEPEDEEGGPSEEGAMTPAEPSAEAGIAAASTEPESGSAEVRERSGRYPHRASRRGRRRPRGDGRTQDPRPQDARPQEGRVAEGRAAEGRGAEGRAAEGRLGESRPEVRGDMVPPQPRERTFSRPAGQSSSSQASGQPSISDLLKEGQEIIVQIAKEPLGQKGARITSHIALPGRYVVYMPTLEHMGVSRKIDSDEERQRLKRILQGRRPGPGGGFITRTAAEGRTEEEIAADMDFLYKLWQDIKNKAERKPAPLLLHHDLDIVQRVLRDQLTDSFKSIWIDNEELYENIMSFVQRFQPALVGKVKLYTREAPIFDAFGITAELEKALRPKVWLKSGGYIVINQTEALVAIDVNTGKYVGKSNRLEDTIVKTNTEAIKEIVRQIRLRDLGGIIVIDFIDMDERKNRQKVMQALEEAMRVDRAPYKILQFNDFGLVAITRKRVKQSLERTLCSPCPHCDGGGYIKSVTTVVSEILTEARKMASSVEGKEVVLRTHPDVAKVLKSNQNKYLEELEEVLRRPVLIKSDPLLHNEKFDLA